VLISIWTAPLNVVRFGATTLWHFDAEERAPSTTSTPDTWLRRSERRYGPSTDSCTATKSAIKSNDQ
jgi:hypothetical protein